LGDLWVFIVAPLVGAALAFVVYKAIIQTKAAE
jgi:glycerol uptake facilitator-like aquaporin